MDGGDYGGGDYGSGDGGGFSNSGGFRSSTDGGFGSSGGDEGFSSSGGADYSNNSRCYSANQGEDNQTNWNQGPFTTSCDEPDKALYVTDDGIFREEENKDRDDQGLACLYPALVTASFMKDPTPNENGEAPMNLLLNDSGDQEEQTEVVGDGCGPVDCLYYSMVCCCTIM